jgi:hypothetical protein
VRVTTENFDSTGRLTGTSITDTKTTLVAVTEESFSLRVESTTELSGKRIPAQPAVVKQHFSGALDGQTSERKSLGESQLTIDGKILACRVQQFEVKGPNGKTVTRTYYSDITDPFVLRRESTMHDASDRMTGESILKVIALERPYRVLTETLPTARVQLTSRHARGREETVAINAVDVPGGIVAHDSREWDASERLVSRSRLELLGYDACSSEPREMQAPRRFPPLPRALRDGLRPMSYRSDGLHHAHCGRGWSLFGRSVSW